MELWMWAVPAAVIAALLIKIYAMKRAAREMAEGLAYILSAGTNNLIGIESADRDMRRLASELNRELAILREQRHRFAQGDREVKKAVTGISHDLRTPLTAAAGYLELLEQEELGAAAKRYVRIIGERIAAMKKLTEELFSYTILLEREPKEKEKVLLNRAVEESAAALYALFCEKGLAPEITLPEEGVYAELDPTALSRLLENLMSNTAKYSVADPKISLTEDGTLLFCNRTSGIRPVEVERIFDRFYTVETQGLSTGLGLSIAKKLTEQMGGRIGASCSGDCLKITVKLPVLESQAQ